jgi:hypothetical protein
MDSVLRFIWIAFREYWATWVTGTGLCGFALWAINYISDRVRSKPMSLRTNLTILFCFFWFLGTFSAWHDADKNLKAVIQQRAEDNSKLNVCNVELRDQTHLGTTIQSELNQSQLLVSGQQTAINSCVGVLAAKQLSGPPKVTTRLVPGDQLKTLDSSGKIIGYGEIFVVQADQDIANFGGTLGCDSPVDLALAGMAGKSTAGMAPQRRSDKEWEINIFTPGLGVGTPFVFLTWFRTSGVHRCNFKLYD